MVNKKILVIAGILVVLAAGVLLWRGRGNNESPAPSALTPMTDDVPRNPNLVGTEDAIVVRHRFINGTHIYAGTLTTPTPCHQVSVDARVMESYPEQIVLSLSVQEPSPDTICVQVIAEQPFSVNVRASEEATVRGELNGVPVRLERVEGGVEFEAPPLGVELVP